MFNACRQRQIILLHNFAKKRNIIVAFMLLHVQALQHWWKPVTETTHGRRILCIEDLAERFNSGHSVKAPWNRFFCFCNNQIRERDKAALSQPHPHTRGGWKRCAATLIGPFLLQLYLTSKGEEKNSNSRRRTKRERSESRWSRLDGKRSVFEELQRVPSLTHAVLKETHYS